MTIALHVFNKRFFLTHLFLGKNRIANDSRFFRIVIFSIFFLLHFATQGATITSKNVTGFWDVGTNWIGDVAPGPGDDVIIDDSATITVRTNVTCLSLTWTGNPPATRVLTINSGFSLTVTGDIILSSPTDGTKNRTINVIGTLNCGGDFVMQESLNNGRDIILSIATTGIATITGNLIMVSAFNRHHVDMTGNAQINIGGNIGANADGTATGGGFTNPPAGSIINLNGTLPQNFFTQNAPTYSGTFKINNPAGVILRRTLALGTSTLTIGDITANSVLKDSGNSITSTGTFNLENGGTLVLGRYSGGAGTATVFPAFSTTNIDLGTTIEYGHINGNQTVSVTPQYANLTFSSSVARTRIIASGTLTVRGNLTIGVNTTFTGNTNNPVTNLGGNFINNGTFNSGTGLFTMNGTTNQSITGTALFSGGLTINNTGVGGSNTITINNNITTAGNLTITNGQLDVGDFTANRTAAGGTLTIANDARLIIGGTNGLPINYSTHVIGATSTVEYNGTTNTVTTPNSSQAYGNLVIAASGAITTGTFPIAGALTVSGSLVASSGIITMNNVASAITNNGTLTFNDLTISATPSLQSQYNTSFTVAGTFATSGAITFEPTGGTITMIGTAGVIDNLSGNLTFQNLVINGTEIASIGNFAVAGTMTVNTVFNPSAASIISGAGTITGSGTVNVTRITATPSFGAQYTINTKTLSSLTVNYIGAGAQTVDAQNYGNLTISTNGTRTVTFVNGGTVRVSGIFSPTATTTTYVVTGNTFEYNGSGAQTIAAFTYNDLILSNAGAKTVLAGTTVNCFTITLNDDAVLTLPDTSVLNVTQ